MKAKTANNNPNRALIIKKQVSKLNKKALHATEGLVDNTLAVAQQWQNLFAKAMKGGVTLLGEQQDLALTTLEAIRSQVLTSSKRVAKLTSLQPLKKSVAVAQVEKKEKMEVANAKPIAKSAPKLAVKTKK